MLGGMWVIPLAASTVALGFAGLLGRRSLRRRHPAELLWAVALLMYAVASLALFLGVVDGWSPGEYRVYWLFGAVLNVPYLAAGELLLLVRDRRVRLPALVLLLVATAFAVARVRTAALDASALVTDLPRGADVWSGDSLALDLARLYAFPAYAFLVGGTLWSAWRMRGRPGLQDRFLGTLAIAIGATVVAAGSAFALSGNVVGFSTTLATGISVMFWGFVRATRPATDRDASSAAADRPA
jgi:peptidoglycan/LPS O-acetylase OafA/YrhL